MAPASIRRGIAGRSSTPTEVATRRSPVADSGLLSTEARIISQRMRFNGPERMSPKIPLLQPTIRHLRRAIRAQAEIDLPSLTPPKSPTPVYEFADMIGLRRAVDDIKASLDDVLELELKECTARTAPPPTLEATEEDHTDYGHNDILGSYGEGIEDASIRDERSDEEDLVIRHIEDTVAGPVEDDGISGSQIDQFIDNEDNQNDVLDDKTIQKSQKSNTPPPVTPPQSTQESLGTSLKTRSGLSRFSPSRLLGIFLPTPFPTPAKPKQRPVAVSPPRRSPTIGFLDESERSSVDDLIPDQLPSSSRSFSSTEEAEPFRLPFDSSDSALSEDELHSPYPSSTGSVKTRQRRHHGLLPTRRSIRTIQPRTSTRLAQMIPPNFRAAGSMGPYKALPGHRTRMDSDRGRNIVRVSAVAIGHKRSGSANSVSSMSSTGSGRSAGDYGGRGGGKRVRFEGFGVR